jgi:hypothetical protein
MQNAHTLPLILGYGYVNITPLPTFPIDRPNALKAAKIGTNYTALHKLYLAKLTRSGKLQTPQGALTGHIFHSSQALGPTKNLD